MQRSSESGRRPWWEILVKKECIIAGGCARGVIVNFVGNEHGDTSSNPGRDWLHFI